MSTSAPDLRAIPSRLNLGLVLLVVSAHWSLLLLATALAEAGAVAYLAFIVPAFASLFLTNYALMHEAMHGSLHARPGLDRILGGLAGLGFPTSTAMMRVFHTVHHRCNRTDHESFELLRAGDRAWLRRLQWWAILLGPFWLILPLGAFAVGFARPLLLTRPFRSARSAAVLFDDFDTATLWRVRCEALAILVIFSALFASGLLTPLPTLLCYAAAAFNWSTRQYVSHAFCPRDVLDGAHNLTASWLMRAVLLNGHCDQAHHRYPLASWIHLPALARELRPPVSYIRQWLRLWRAPIRDPGEPAPRPLATLRCVRSSIRLRCRLRASSASRS